VFWRYFRCDDFETRKLALQQGQINHDVASILAGIPVRRASGAPILERLTNEVETLESLLKTFDELEELDDDAPMSQDDAFAMLSRHATGPIDTESEHWLINEPDADPNLWTARRVWLCIWDMAIRPWNSEDNEHEALLAALTARREQLAKATFHFQRLEAERSILSEQDLDLVNKTRTPLRRELESIMRLIETVRAFREGESVPLARVALTLET
jgi:hypothetical protein